MAKGKVRKWKPYSVCGDCHKHIDLEALELALKNGDEYRHDCGRILIRART